MTIGIPYTGLSYTFSVPNVALIPQWIGKFLVYAIEWTFGWIGAIFLFAVQFATAEIYNGLTWLINFLFREFNDLIRIAENVSKGMGAFAPLMIVAILGLITVSALAIAFAVGKLIINSR